MDALVKVIFSDIIIYVFIMILFSDIDECFEAALMSTDLCADDRNTQCMNLEGSYECTCVSGYSRENGTCQSKFIIVCHFLHKRKIFFFAEIENDRPPPLPPVLIPVTGMENSVIYTAPTITSGEVCDMHYVS